MSKEIEPKQITCSQAGEIGGKTTLAKYGLEHFRKIGQRGQKATDARYGNDIRSAWGKLGGRPKKTRIQLEGVK